ncbi:MAG: restriction endonuclease subunit S [Nitrospira sp.]|nr:restriction endonuclease subunit S [Nitrospira sp.]
MVKDEALPEGWRRVKLGDVCKVITSPVDKKTVDGELPVKLCNYTDVYYNNTIDSEINFMVATAKPQEIEKFSIIKEDVIITKDSEMPDDIGIPAYVKETINNLLCGYHLTILRPKKQTIGKYVCYALTSPRVRYDFYRYANGITRFGLPTESYQKITIPLPPLPEQKAIASLLETWDTAIEKTERLIAAKEKQFKWLLKRLISDQQNNPEWHKVKLGNLCIKILGGGTPSTANTSYWEGHIPWMTSADIVDAKTIKARKYITIQAVTDSATSLIPKNNIIVVTRVGLGKAVKNEMDICISQDSQGLILKKSVNADFLIHCLLEKIKVFKSASQGSTIQGITKKRLFDIEVSLPSLPQQRQIARQLDIVEREIGLLKQFVEKRRIQKHGLMQKLLTEEWRISC